MPTPELTKAEQQAVKACLPSKSTPCLTQNELGSLVCRQAQLPLRLRNQDRIQPNMSLIDHDEDPTRGLLLLDACDGFNKILSNKNIFTISINNYYASNNDIYSEYKMILTTRIVDIFTNTIRTLISTLLVIFLKILTDNGDGAPQNRRRILSLRKIIRQSQIKVCRELLERALDIYGVSSTIREDKLRTILAVIEEASFESTSRAPRRYKTSSTRFEENLEKQEQDNLYQSVVTKDKNTIRKLDDYELNSIKQIGRENPWSRRPIKSISCFDWIRSNYAQWIDNGLMQSHLHMADKKLYFAFKKRVERDGLPSWLPIYTSYDNNIEEAALAGEGRRLLSIRALARERKRAIKLMTGNKVLKLET